MSIAVRSTETTWEGPLATGTGKFTADSSGALEGMEATWASRTDSPQGRTSPEELAAAAHSSCFSMALALRLGEHDAPPRRLRVEARVSLDEVDGTPTITSSALRVRAQVPELDSERFAAVVNEAAALCPVSRLYAGTEVSVDAQLDEPA